MKKLLIIPLLILLMPLVAMSADRIIIKGKNHVEWAPSIIMTDVNGNPVEVWDEPRTKAYGQDGIDEELVDALKDLADAQTLDCPIYKQEQIDKDQVEVDLLTAIKIKVIESNK